MKILLTGGGSGGHFYPLMAVAERLREKADNEKIVDVDLYYMSNTPYSEKDLYEHKIKYIEQSASDAKRMRTPFDYIPLFFKVLFSSIGAIGKLFKVYPDVVFSKGGYPALPVVIAAWFLRIPVIIHASDSVPGMVNRFTSRFANRVAISYKEAYAYFPKEKTAMVGHIVRPAVELPIKDGNAEYFELNPTLKTILILGGSQGSRTINKVVLDSIKELIQDYQVIHQAGSRNFEEAKAFSDVILDGNKNKDRYKVVPYLNTLGTRMAAGIADLVIARAGAGHISEIAVWGIPSILIPLVGAHGDTQRKNAFEYARTKACTVLEENNLSAKVMYFEIKRILEDKELIMEMKEGTKDFVYPEAANKVADEIIYLGLHKKKTN
jgi:UDP-N-acetylglucosamine--N-acetylmuramyl-(pentapeptide) pyrophosphoryl-undecaprenol N-acetylglucosamine transferase